MKSFVKLGSQLQGKLKEMGFLASRELGSWMLFLDALLHQYKHFLSF